MNQTILAFIVQRLLESLPIAITYVAPCILLIKILTFLALDELAAVYVFVRVCLRIYHRRVILLRLSFMQNRYVDFKIIRHALSDNILVRFIILKAVKCAIKIIHILS